MTIWRKTKMGLTEYRKVLWKPWPLFIVIAAIVGTVLYLRWFT